MRTQSLLMTLLSLTLSSQALDSQPEPIQYDVTYEVDNIFHVDLRTEVGGGCKAYKDQIILGYDQAISAIEKAYEAVQRLSGKRPDTDERERFEMWTTAALAVQDMFGFDVPRTGPEKDDSKDAKKSGAENLKRIQGMSEVYRGMLNAHKPEFGTDKRAFELKCTDDWFVHVQADDDDPTTQGKKVRDNPAVKTQWASSGSPKKAMKAGIYVSRKPVAFDQKYTWLWHDAYLTKDHDLAQPVCFNPSFQANFLPDSRVITLCPVTLQQTRWSLKAGNNPISVGSSINSQAATMASVLIRQIGKSVLKLESYGRPRKNAFHKTVLDDKVKGLGWTDSFDLAKYKSKLALNSVGNYADFALAMYLDAWCWADRDGKATKKSECGFERGRATK